MLLMILKELKECIYNLIIIIYRRLSYLLPLHYFFFFAFWKMGYSKLGEIAIILMNLQIYTWWSQGSYYLSICHNFGHTKPNILLNVCW